MSRPLCGRFIIDLRQLRTPLDKSYGILYNTSMKRNKSSEDYLECILLLSRESEHVHRVDVARRVGVSQPAVQKAIRILSESGYVEFDGMHIFLTARGEEYASRVYERHCIIREFLKKHGVNSADADADACELEHIISDATFEMMKKYISDPQ